MRELVRAAIVTALLLWSARYSSASPGSFVYVVAPSCDASSIPSTPCTLNLYVYDAATSGPVTTIVVGSGLDAWSPALAISPDGSRIYVLASTLLASSTSVTVVDATRHQVLSSFATPAGALALAVSRDGHMLLVAGTDGNFLYDIASEQQIAQLQGISGVFFSPAVAADPIRDRVYWTALARCGATLHAYDTALGSEIALTSPPSSINWWLRALPSRDGTRLYLTAPGSPPCGTNSGGRVLVVDLATFGTIANLSLVQSGIAFPDGTVEAPTSQRLYIWDYFHIRGFDRNTFASVGSSFSVGGVTSIAVTADESRAYVTTAPSIDAPSALNSLTVLNFASSTVGPVIPLPGKPYNVVATPPAPASNVCSYRVNTHQSSWSVNGGSAPVALTTNCAWTASSSASWAHIVLQSGTGSATLNLSVDPNFTTTNRAATVDVGGQLVTVTQASFSATPPFGSFDTPADGSTGLSGAIAVTGWALDDVGVTAVRIYRDPVAGESAAQQIFIGNATFVDGARPDVQAVYPSFPNASRAGWGLQLLTNMLPNGGTGTYRLYAYADDVDGHTTLLGFKTIGTNNQTATVPFGTIDTPGQGDSVSGTIVNFGWALSSNLIAMDGSTIDVIVDGVLAGHPVYNNFRVDIAGLFPGFPNSNGAIGYFILDTTTLANGVHTIAWIVRDSTGAAQGIGSRFFTVVN